MGSAPPLPPQRSGNTDWHPLIGGFLAEKTAGADVRGTAHTYARIIDRFIASRPSPERVSAIDVHQFAYGLAANDDSRPSPSTTAVRLAALSGLFDFAVRMGVLPENPVAKVRRPKGRSSSPRGLTATEVKTLLSGIPEGPAGSLDRAMITTAVLTGLRRAELVNMEVRGLQRVDRAVYEVTTKGGAVRQRALPEPARREIERACRAAGRPISDDPIRAFPIAESTFHARLARHAEAARLGRVSPHVLRHSAAKLRRDAGASVEQVSWLLGHRSIATTARYLARLETEVDDDWSAVADLIGLGDERERRIASRRTVESPWLWRPDHDERQGGRWRDRPVWEGEQVHAHPPKTERTVIDGSRSRPRPGPSRARRRRAARPRRARAGRELLALREPASTVDGR